MGLWPLDPSRVSQSHFVHSARSPSERPEHFARLVANATTASSPTLDARSLFLPASDIGSPLLKHAASTYAIAGGFATGGVFLKVSPRVLLGRVAAACPQEEKTDAKLDEAVEAALPAARSPRARLHAAPRQVATPAPPPPPPVGAALPAARSARARAHAAPRQVAMPAPPLPRLVGGPWPKALEERPRATSATSAETAASSQDILPAGPSMAQRPSPLSSPHSGCRSLPALQRQGGTASAPRLSGEALATRIEALAKRRGTSELKLLVADLFVKVVAGRDGLDLAGLNSLRENVAEELGVPSWVFKGSLVDEYIRFDFNGDGTLQERECYKLLKSHMREHIKRTAPQVSETSIPCKSLWSAGYVASQEELGHGSQGVLKLALTRSGSRRCLKCIRKSTLGHRGELALLEEFAAVQRLRHDSLARTFDLFHDGSFYYTVHEPYLGGDFTKLRQRVQARGVQLSEEWWRLVVRQCLEGLRYLHGKAMIHCDIKEPNLMLKTDDLAKPDVVIIDFGIAQGDASDRQQVCGTPGYIPPETWSSHKWFPKGDCFALGVSILQLLVDRVPVVRDTPHGVVTVKTGIFTQGTRSMRDVAHVTRVRPAPLHALPAACPGLQALLERLLVKRQEGRVNAVQALNDAWFAAPSVSAAPFWPESGHPAAAATSCAAASVAGAFAAASAAQRFLGIIRRPSANASAARLVDSSSPRHAAAVAAAPAWRPQGSHIQKQSIHVTSPYACQASLRDSWSALPRRACIQAV